VKEGNAKLEQVGCQAQAAYMFIKSLPTTLFENSKNIIGMKDKKNHLSLQEDFVS